MKVVVFLEWKEKCFRVDPEALRYLREKVGDSPRIVRARSEKAFLRELKDATHVITWHFKREWFAIAKKLELLATPAAGRELVPETGPEGVRIHFGHYHGDIMAENVAAYVLAVSRGFFFKGTVPWPRVEMSDKCRTVAGTKAVIAGYGSVGRAIGAKLAALGVEVKGFGRKNLAELPAAAKTADWFVMALPSTTGTDDFLGAKLIAKLPRRCRVINVGRGNAIDEAALAKALRSGRLAGAYLDVLKYEPSGTVPVFKGATGDFLAGTVPGCVVTPHSSAFSPDYIKRCFKELKDEGCI